MVFLWNVFLVLTNLYDCHLMKRKLSLIFILFVFVTNCGGNLPPVISSLTANFETVAIGGQVLLTCEASDDEDSDLDYLWECSNGLIAYEGNSATWTAPNEKGVFSISCEVMDSNNGHDIKTIDITVI